MSRSFFYQTAISPCSFCSISFLPPPATFSSPSLLQIIKFCPNIILLHVLKSVSEPVRCCCVERALPAVATLHQDTWLTYVKWSLQEPPCPNRLMTLEQSSERMLYWSAWVGWTAFLVQCDCYSLPFFRLQRGFDTFIFYNQKFHLNYPDIFFLCNYKVLLW